MALALLRFRDAVIATFLSSVAAFAQGGDTGTLCAGAQIIAPGGVYSGSTKGSPLGEKVSCADSDGSAAAWFKYSAPVDQTLKLRATSLFVDTVLSVHDGCTAKISSEVACDDDGAGSFNPELSIEVKAGHTYFVRVAGVSGASGRYRLTVDDLKRDPVSKKESIATAGLEQACEESSAGALWIISSENGDNITSRATCPGRDGKGI